MWCVSKRTWWLYGEVKLISDCISAPNVTLYVVIWAIYVRKTLKTVTKCYYTDHFCCTLLPRTYEEAKHIHYQVSGFIVRIQQNITYMIRNFHLHVKYNKYNAVNWYILKRQGMLYMYIRTITGGYLIWTLKAGDYRLYYITLHNRIFGVTRYATNTYVKFG